MMKTLPVAFVSDDQGVLLLGIALYSLLSSANHDTRYRIYILDDRISCVNREKIRSLKDMFQCDIRFIPIHQMLDEYIAVSFEQWPAAVFGRLFLPKLLPHEDIVLYLDIDTLVCRDLASIADLDLGAYHVGAVYQAENQQSEVWKTRLRIPQQYSYFNSGVLYMNLHVMRNERFVEMFLAYLQENGKLLNCPDQDILNAMLYDRVKALDPAWNWPTSQTRKMLLGKVRCCSGWGRKGFGEMLKAANRPYIIHFIGNPKPIHHNYKFHGRLYRRIWKKSPWGREGFSGKGRLHHLLRRWLYVPFDLLVRLRIRLLLKRQGGRGGGR